MWFDMESVMDFALDIGEEILRSGGEIRRAEDSLTRVCRAYGCERVDVFCITSVIILNVRVGEKSWSRMRRIGGYGNNMARLEAVNDLCRRICACPEDPADVKRQLAELRGENGLRLWRKWVGSITGAGGFALFFGGGSADGVFGFLIGALLRAVTLLTEKAELGRIFDRFSCSFLVSLLSYILLFMGMIPTVDYVIIGNIMLLIPGIGLTNALRDLFVGDSITGLFRLIEALLMALAIKQPIMGIQLLDEAPLRVLWIDTEQSADTI
jgi:uncharacterized membrane protein YjjP (DUF1212 family)